MSTKIREKSSSILTTSNSGEKVNIDIRSIKRNETEAFVFFKVNGEKDIMPIGYFKEKYPELKEVL